MARKVDPDKIWHPFRPFHKTSINKTGPFTKFYFIKSYFSVIILILLDHFKLCNLQIEQVYQKKKSLAEVCKEAITINAWFEYE